MPPFDAPTAKEPKERRYLTAEGYALLNQYFAQTPSPDKERYGELYARLHAMPGCEWYTPDALRRWFAVKRRTIRDRAKTGAGVGRSVTPTVASSSRDILYPSLTSPAIAALEILIRESPSPTDLEISVWARRLRADSTDVQTWIDLWRARNPEAAAGVAKAEPHWPTPEPSASPPPTLSPSSTVCPGWQPTGSEEKCATLSPKPPATAVEEKVPDMEGIEYHVTETPGTEQSSESIIPFHAAFFDLRQRLQEALSQNEPTPVVRTVDDFTQWIDPHSARMVHFLEAAQQGKYAYLGIDSDLVGDLSPLKNIAVTNLTPTNT